MIGGDDPMSMLGNFRQVSPALLARIKAKPALVQKVVRYRPPGAPPESDAEAFISLLPAHMRKAMDAMPPEVRAGFLAHVDSSVADMPAVLKDQIAAVRRPTSRKHAHDTAIQPADGGAELDLGQAWHGVHFPLCGSAGEAAGPLGSAVLGGREIGSDLGYGPARYLEPSEVTDIAGALAPLTTEALAARFDPIVMDQHKIYPGHWA